MSVLAIYIYIYIYISVKQMIVKRFSYNRESSQQAPRGCNNASYCIDWLIDYNICPCDFLIFLVLGGFFDDDEYDKDDDDDDGGGDGDGDDGDD